MRSAYTATSTGNTGYVALLWAVPPPLPPTIQKINAVQTQLASLVTAGALAAADAAGLTAKLDATAQAIGRGSPTAASNVLDALLNQLAALVRSKRISQADADALALLIDEAIATL